MPELTARYAGLPIAPAGDSDTKKMQSRFYFIVSAKKRHLCFEKCDN